MTDSVKMIVMVGPERLTLPIDKTTMMVTKVVSRVACCWTFGEPISNYPELNALIEEIASTHSPDDSVEEFYGELNRIIETTVREFYDLWDMERGVLSIRPNTFYRSLASRDRDNAKVVCAANPFDTSVSSAKLVEGDDASAGEGYRIMERAKTLGISTYLGCS